MRSTAYISPLPSSVISPGYNPLNHPLDPFNLKFPLLTLDISSFLAQRLPTVIINSNNESRFCHCRSCHCTTGVNVPELASVSWSDTFFLSSQPFLKQGLVGLVTGFLGGLFGTIYPVSAIQPLATCFISPYFLHYITAELWISVALLTLPVQ